MGKSKDVASNSSRNSTVGQLYSLRAGLSVISERADNIRVLERDIESERLRTKPIQDEIDKNERKIRDTMGSVDRLKEQIKSTKEKKSERVNSTISKKTHGCQYASINISEYKGFIIIGAIIIVCSLFIWFMFRREFLWQLIGVPIGLLLVIIPIIVGFVQAKKYKKYQQSVDMQVTQDINKEVEELEKQIDALLKTISLIQQNNDELRTKKKELNNDIEQRVAEINSDIAEIVEDASLINSALETAYAGLLNPADWHNTDLCIFYLQTGRADNIKECLLLADRQRQNDEIVVAIKSAGDRICGEIRSGFNALGRTMVTCLNALSMQIETMGNSLAAQHNETIRALGRVENTNAALLSATQLNNALQAKANETSEALLRDYRYVQNHSGIAI